MTKDLNKISKFLSYVLRHHPEAIDIKLDSEGWVNIEALIVAAKQHNTALTLDVIQTVVASCDKQRFAISADALSIRAVQGHSTHSVDIAYEQKIPPTFLYHGTATRFLESIQEKGLLAGSRQYVHLSQEAQTARMVGMRHGKPVILQIEALKMHQQGFKFYQAENGVWLVDGVPALQLNVFSKD